MAPLHRAAAAAAVAAPSDLQLGAQMIQHFTHPHPLQHVHMPKEFNCNGCNIIGLGARYHCPSCDFHLHEQCGRSPFTLDTPHLHPHHQLKLVNYPGKSHFCDLCGAIADGMFYTCQACDIDIHPLCSQLPVNVHHAFHPQHPLTLQPGHPRSCCNVCRQGCGTWRYKCNSCDHVDVHLNCVVPPPQVQVQEPGCLPPPAWVPQQAVGFPDGGGNYGKNQPIPNYQAVQAVGYPNDGGGGNYYGTNQPTPNYQAVQAVGHPYGGGVGSYVTSQPIYETQGSGNGRKSNGTDNMALKIGKFAVGAVITSLTGVPMNLNSSSSRR